MRLFNLQVGEEPPYLSAGTEVSAKYRGAFCEATIKIVKKMVKCKVFIIYIYIYIIAELFLNIVCRCYDIDHELLWEMFFSC